MPTDSPAMTVQRALALLECPPPPVQGCTTQAQVDAAVADWRQAVLRPAYRAQAKRWHPDRHPPDQQDEATARMAQVSAAYALLKEVRVLRRPPPVQRVVRVVWSTTTCSASTTTTATSTGGWGWSGGWSSSGSSSG